MRTKILILGAGVAGPTVAFWLARYGFEPTLVERAPTLRSGGYVIDFWGAAFDLAQQMGILGELEQDGYHVQELRIVDDAGNTVGGFDASVFERLTGGRYLTVARSRLSRALYEHVHAGCERLFGKTIRTLTEDADGVDVQFDDGIERRFDLVVGADGQHSRVRELVFGPESQFEKYLGYNVAAFEVAGYPERVEDTYVMHTQRGQQIARFSLRGDRTLFLFVWRAPDAPLPRTLEEQRALIRERFGDGTWESEEILASMLDANEMYMDRVSQIRMPSWAHGRVALAGDAAHCVSLLAGQGSALAMISGTVLAGELLLAHGDHQVAFERYQTRLSQFMHDKQRAAESFGGAFAPKTSLGLFFRNQASKLLRMPLVADLALTRGLRDTIELPDYRAALAH
ncbi:MAG TPA: FAD-binding domain [Polyangiales bacterium]|nr:FAD-binding domain [Polyangiales bacterium]